MKSSAIKRSKGAGFHSSEILTQGLVIQPEAPGHRGTSFKCISGVKGKNKKVR